jgi:hypothetical protein
MFVTEYAESDINSAKEPPLAEQAFAFTGTSAQCSNAFNARTRLVRIHTDAICSIAFAKDPTATANNRRLAINSTEYFSVEGGLKVAAITNT